jgi:hypothetical protein
MDQNLERQLTKAKFQLISEQPFFGYLLLSLRAKAVDWCPTMGVDGKFLYINPKFAAELKPYEFKYVLAHEILHMVYKHHLRGPVQISPRELNERVQNGDPEMAELMYKHKKYNIAGDLRINADLKNDFGMRMPTTIKPLYDRKFDDSTKWYTEKIYREIPDPTCPKCGKSQGKLPQNGGCSCSGGKQRVKLKNGG